MVRGVVRMSALLVVCACSSPSVRGPRTDVPPDPSVQTPDVQIVLSDTPHSEPLMARVRLGEVDRSRFTVSWSWTRDGAPTEFASRIVPASQTAPGEVWEATATASDGTSTASATRSVRVTNRAPELIGARITPELVRASSTLDFVYDEVFDHEDDPVSVSWSWWVDGVEAAADGPLPGSALAGGEQVVLRAVTGDGYDERVTELGPVFVPEARVAVDLVVVVDITGSTHNEFPELAWTLRDLATRAADLSGPNDRLGLVLFAWKYGYEHTPLTDPGFRARFAGWSEVEHASRIRGSEPDLDDDGLRPDMPREYDGEQGSDPHVGLAMARKMLTERPHDDRELVILLVTDGQPLPVGRSDVRERIGYVEDRWRFVEGVAPHSSGEIADVTIATAEEAWEVDRISTFVVSVRDSEPFLERTAQGRGTFQQAPTDDQAARALSMVVSGLPWGGE